MTEYMVQLQCIESDSCITVISEDTTIARAIINSRKQLTRLDYDNTKYKVIDYMIINNNLPEYRNRYKNNIDTQN